MKIGVIYPQTEFGTDTGALKEWTQGAEQLGLSHITAFDHVINANSASRPGWNPPYDLESQFYEPLALFCFMAGITGTIGFLTSILILPQRQTVLVAKQAACLDVLCGGRLRLGVGTGWNHVEYEALNVPFGERGEIFDDQIGVLRELWTKPAITLKTPYHAITDAGINPLPVQRPIPLWFGGGSPSPFGIHPNMEKVTRRIARLGDGWLLPGFAPFSRDDLRTRGGAPNEDAVEIIERFRGYVREYGRNPAKVGIEVTINTSRENQATWIDTAKFWQNLDVNYLSINTMFDGLRGCEQHLRRLEEAAKAIRGGIGK
jgi:probable F420-dependent oxidoreductase